MNGFRMRGMPAAHPGGGSAHLLIRMTALRRRAKK
jgi:hypothetical protein